MTRTEDYDPGIGRSVPVNEADEIPWSDETCDREPETGLPDLWISLRQPWAWLVVNGWKNVENRTWSTKVRGRIGIHAAKGCSFEEWESCVLFVDGFAPHLAGLIPQWKDLPRGGIVGETTLLDCVHRHDSDWFCGPYGFVLDNSRPLPLMPCRGALGFFTMQTIGTSLQPVLHKRNIA